MKREDNGAIDIFITWVDSSDEIWKKEKQEWERKLNKRPCNDDDRYQSWDNLQYLFRGIESCMPWINRVFFITWGHVPDFLNINHPKLVIVRHKDYIPEEYLPTYNSNVIEMNLHRIEELSENFILFNDDTFPIQPIEESYYFKNNKVCDEAIETIIAPHNLPTMVGYYRNINISAIINKHFNKREVQRKNFKKWFNLEYGIKGIRTIILHYYKTFSFFTNSHEPQAMKKSTLKEIWNKEEKLLHTSSQNKFRSYSDVGQYLIRFWQLCKGEFYPKRRIGKSFMVNDKNCRDVANIIRQKKYKVISINEEHDLGDWEFVKSEINKAFQEIFPDKSSFEL